MATDLLLPNGVKPTNLHLPEGVSASFIDSDVFGVCEQIREISPDLYVVLLRGEQEHAFAIMESCRDGVERLVFRVRELDGRTVQKLREIAALPLEVRYEQLEQQELRREAERRENEFEELYDRLGGPMWNLLERTGFIQRPVSYPKRGVTGGKGARKAALIGA